MDLKMTFFLKHMQLQPQSFLMVIRDVAIKGIFKAPSQADGWWSVSDYRHLDHHGKKWDVWNALYEIK